jgi:hypothetical protein
VRIQRGERRAIGGVDELAADEQLVSNRTRGLRSHVNGPSVNLEEIGGLAPEV